MSFSSNSHSVAFVSGLKSLQKQTKCRVGPLPLIQVDIETKGNIASKPKASTSRSVFVVENEVTLSKSQKKLSSIADDILGDIGDFMHYVRKEPVNASPVIVSLEDEDEIATNIVAASNESLQQENIQEEIELESVLENIHNSEESEETANTSNTEITASNKSLQQENIQEEIQEEIGVNPVIEDIEISDENTLINEFFANKGISNEYASATYKPSCYICMHFDLMYILGTSTFTTKEQTPRNTWTSYTQMAFFALIFILSTLQSFFDAKYCFIWFLYGGGLNLLVRVAFNLTCLVSSAYGAYILCYKGKELRNMFNKTSSYEQTWTEKTKSPSFSVALAVTTTFLAVMKPLLVVTFEDFSVKAVLLDGSYAISEDIFMWRPSNLNISIEQLDADFGTNLSSISITMGVFKFVRDFAFNLQQGMVWDIFANIILDMFSWILVFMVFVNAVKDNVPDDMTDEEEKLQRMRVVVWKRYREIRDMFAAVNNVFGPLLMLFHITNVLRYAFLMELCIFPEDSTAFTYIHLLYDIIKSEVIYLIATNIAQQNKIIRKWLRNWAIETGKIDLGKKKLDITVVLDELDEEPLGLGQGDFVIDQSFHFGLLGLVSSLFVILANKTGVKA